jgi:hypothetical protein
VPRLLSLYLDGRARGQGNQLQTAKREHNHRFGRVRDAQRDRLGSRFEAEAVLERRHFIRLVPEDPFGHGQRVPDPAVTTADLQVLSNRAGFHGVTKGDLVVAGPVDLCLPGNLSAARLTEAVPACFLRESSVEATPRPYSDMGASPFTGIGALLMMKSTTDFGAFGESGKCTSPPLTITVIIPPSSLYRFSTTRVWLSNQGSKAPQSCRTGTTAFASAARLSIGCSLPAPS